MLGHLYTSDINNMKFVNPLLTGHSEMGTSANSEDPWMREGWLFCVLCWFHVNPMLLKTYFESFLVRQSSRQGRDGQLFCSV